MAQKKIGVVLFQLGGPDSLDAIEPFLYNLFCDPDIIDFPFARIARQPLAKLISMRRATPRGASLRRDRRQVAHPGIHAPAGRSAGSASCAANSTHAWWWPCATGIRSPQEAIAELAAHAPEEVVLLPLYPQYSKTTTGSSLNEWNRRFHPNGWNPRVHVDCASSTRTQLISMPWSQPSTHRSRDFEDLADVDIVFSAHSVPVAVIENGDPYQRQIEHTVDLVWQRGGWPARRHLCYQSKVGASKWLRPSMHETVKNLAAAGSRHVLVVPISFVSDHVETLHEIDIEHREQARRLGIENYRMMPGLNDSPAFIAALAGLVRQQVAFPHRYPARPEVRISGSRGVAGTPGPAQV